MKHKIKKSNSFLTRQTEACKLLQLKNAQKNIILRLDDKSLVSKTDSVTLKLRKSKQL